MGLQRFSHLDEATKYQYVIGIVIVMPTGKFFDTIIDVDYWYHAFSYIYTQTILVEYSN